MTTNTTVASLGGLAQRHREMAEVIEWLAGQVPTLQTQPLPGESVEGPHGWSYKATGFKTWIALIVKAPSPELAEMLGPREELPPFVSVRRDEYMFEIPRPDED